jgi:uncharacterized protein YdhG (YjbR/CyaY superfamily)
MENTTGIAPAKTVDEYLDRLPADVHQMLQRVRETIIKTVPEAQELISYQIPGYKYKGYSIHFAAFKNHCSLIPVHEDIAELLAVELKPFKIKGKTLHFTVNNPLPAELVKKIVELRLKAKGNA